MKNNNNPNIEWNLILKLAWSFVHTTGLDFEDLKSEATLAYLKALKTFNPEKGTLITTWVYSNIKSALIRYSKSENNFKHGPLPDYLLDDSFNRKIKFQNVIEAASPDVHSIYEIILKRPNYFLQFNSRKARRVIRDILRENKKWSMPRIWKAIREMKMCLNEID